MVGVWTARMVSLGPNLRGTSAAILGALLVACVNGADGSEQTRGAAAREVEVTQESIRVANAAFADALLTGDVQALHTILAPDAVLSGPGLEEWRGRRAVVEYLGAHLRDATYTTARFHTEEVDLEGGVAIETGQVGFAWTVRGAAAPESLQLKYLTVWRRERDGSVSILRSVRMPDQRTVLQ